MDVAAGLRQWFRDNARALPWRSEPRDPYRVLVSELMLQQTQVERVVPAFLAFVDRFPSLAAVAAAGEDGVVAAWSGLGYYRRARLLHRLAHQVTAAGGVLPCETEELRRLPGIGPYTAAAVASVAFGRRAPALDGNVLRVASRYLAFEGDVRGAPGRRVVAAWVAGLMAGGEPPGVVNEALMELGATVCVPASPRCGGCPLREGCRASMEGRQGRYPTPRPRRAAVDLRWVAACCVDREGRWLLRRVTAGSILIGLWLPPLAELGDSPDAVHHALRLVASGHVPAPPARLLPEVSHSITHRRIRILPVLVDGAAGGPLASAGDRWMDPQRERFPTSSLLAKLVAAATPRRAAD